MNKSLFAFFMNHYEKVFEIHFKLFKIHFKVIFNFYYLVKVVVSVTRDGQE